MADVLSVAAIELRDPVPLFILMEADDASFHSQGPGVP